MCTADDLSKTPNQRVNLFNIKRRLLGCERKVASFQPTLQHDSKPTRLCLAWLRIAKAQPWEVEVVTRQRHALYSEPPTFEQRPFPIAPFSVANELAVLQAICRSAQQGLKMFSTSLQQDDAMLIAGAYLLYMRHC